jgi:hypothetical protein
MEELTLANLKLAILKCLVDTTAEHAVNKFNLLGRPYQAGGLERSLELTFDSQQRALANRAFEELKAGGLITPTLADLVSPEHWVAITDAGKAALQHGLLDDLDVALTEINPSLVEMRRGAWTALSTRNADSVRQAAHSGRELISQVLQQGAPDSEIKAKPGFHPDSSSGSGITRRMRLKHLMAKRRESSSDSDLEVAEKAIDFVIALTDRLSAAAHDRGIPSEEDIRDLLLTADVALRCILL